MSDNSDTSDDPRQRGANNDDICRDFLRNVCQRGKRCRYRHPPSAGGAEAVVDVTRRHDYTFCHDFQNTGCRRGSCRFIHCTKDEEEEYRRTGQLPGRLQQAVSLGIGLNTTETPLLQGEVPICKDFLKGECKRGVRCKFRHVASSPSQPDVAQDVGGSMSRAGSVGGLNERRLRTTISTMDTFESVYNDYVRYDYEHTLKRRRLEDEFNNKYSGSYRTVIPTALDYRLLEEDNILLRHKVEELRKQVSDLAATNEVLLEQNARFRTVKLTATANVTQPTIVPMMTVTQVVTPSVAHAPVVARTALAERATFCQMASALPQHINSGDLVVPVSQQALQSLANAVTVPSAAMNTAVTVPLNPSNLGPVSIPLESALAPPGGIVAVSLGQQQGGLTQTSLLNSGVTTTLVSYPIMSHTQLPNSTMG